MKIIVVAGAHSGSGKTSCAEKLLGVLTGWAALKITVKGTAGCPRGKGGCRVCADIKDNFEIIDEQRIINQAGSDTSRLKKAGAEKVIWLKSTARGLRAGALKALAKLKRYKGVLIEGTSVLKYIKADIVFFVGGGSKNMRPSAKSALNKADIVILRE